MLHATNRSRSGFIGDLGSVALNGAVVLLALMGIAGVIFKVFKPGGWLARIAGDMAHSDAMEVVIGLGIAGWAGLCAKRWFDALDGAEGHQKSAVLAEADHDRPGVIVAEIDTARTGESRRKIPNLRNAREFSLRESAAGTPLRGAAS